jgi:hypothetical protein
MTEQAGIRSADDSDVNTSAVAVALQVKMTDIAVDHPRA